MANKLFQRIAKNPRPLKSGVRNIEREDTMGNTDQKPPGFVLIRKEFAILDAEVINQENKLGKTNNNGRKILATQVMPQFGEVEIVDPVWKVPAVLATGQGSLEVATFTEYAGQDRHKHKKGIEIYTVMRGTLSIFVDDKGPYVINEGDEIIILPETVHEVIQQDKANRPPFKDFNLLVRVHSINCFGDEDKFVQLSQAGDWQCWKDLSKDQRGIAYRKQAVSGQ